MNKNKPGISNGVLVTSKELKQHRKERLAAARERIINSNLFKTASADEESVLISRERWDNIVENYAEFSITVEDLQNEPDELANVIALGAIMEGDVVKVRVTKPGGGDDTGYLVPVFHEFTDDLEEGQEVILRASTLIATVPDNVKKPVPKPDFQPVQWNDIIGLDEQVARIRKAVAQMKMSKELEKYGAKPRTGLCLYGPPGTGKTLIAQAIATEIYLGEEDVPAEAFMYYKGGEMLSRYVGESERQIKEAFQTARDYMKKTGKPAIIFIDEAEAILPRRGSRQSSDVDTTIVPTFLSEMQGLNKDRPFVILATNHKNKIDEAVLRSGRVDIHEEITRPSQEGYLQMIAHYLGKTPVNKSVEIAQAITDLTIKTYQENVSTGADAASVVQCVVSCAYDRISKETDKGNYKAPKDIVQQDIEEGLAEFLTVRK